LFLYLYPLYWEYQADILAYILHLVCLKKRILETVSKDYTVPFSKLKYKVNIFELGKNKINLPFKLVFDDLLHSVKTLGFRFEINGKVISVISDTGYCENAVKLSLNSDLLITECSYLPNEANKLWPHLNPQTALKLKNKSNSKKLALTHFAADKYLTINERLNIK
ncbi:MAG: MBL fold metallo-hydrolase, partial [Elusimicrobiales bacterium]|nr:MBL fold metallo-hydrolase [Elusimicrobiales bacterium]